ncbi:hypothetical protein TWF192_000139 [Orbilia oligospora]|nr:hypothetical protein TWF192_000139 [Orbilia oligospora]
MRFLNPKSGRIAILMIGLSVQLVHGEMLQLSVNEFDTLVRNKFLVLHDLSKTLKALITKVTSRATFGPGAVGSAHWPTLETIVAQSSAGIVNAGQQTAVAEPRSATIANDLAAIVRNIPNLQITLHRDTWSDREGQPYAQNLWDRIKELSDYLTDGGVVNINKATSLLSWVYNVEFDPIVGIYTLDTNKKDTLEIAVGAVAGDLETETSKLLGLDFNYRSSISRILDIQLVRSSISLLHRSSSDIVQFVGDYADDFADLKEALEDLEVQGGPVLAMTRIPNFRGFSLNASGMGFIPVSEFEEWLKDRPIPQYLTEITDSLDLLTTKYFPPDPNYKPGTLPQSLQTILNSIHESLTSLETSNKNYINTATPAHNLIDKIQPPPESTSPLMSRNKQKQKLVFSTDAFFTKVLNEINTPFTHREDMWENRPLEKAALTPTHPSVFSALQEFCDHLRTNVDFQNTTTLGVWLYSGRIKTRRNINVAWYYLDARDALSQLFGRFYTALSEIYKEVEKMTGTVYWSLDDPVSKAASLGVLEPLRVYVKKVEQAVYLIYWNMMHIRIEPEKENLMNHMNYNPGLNGRKPMKWMYNIDPRNLGR